ncbi:MAG TPA: ScpA family protein [Candidatus Dormibacteraeota bacterium]|nr:ScpA family protein [Candidatus Dormibacteraeota bacterium]
MTDGPEFSDSPGAPGEAAEPAANGAAPTANGGDAAAPHTEIPVHAHTAELTEAGGRFHVELAVYQGPLDGLVGLAQRGEIDLAEVPVSEITATYRRWLDASDPKPEAREVADFLTLAGRLLTLKAQRLLPDGPLEVDTPAGEETEVLDDPGARLAEYRLFKEAAEALLSEVAEQGARSFLSLVAPDVIPVERLAIPAERLAAAFRAVLERIPEVDPLHLQASLFSVEEKLAGLRDMLRSRRSLKFDELFHDVRSRLEAVATFLALLELLKAGSARVSQSEAFGDITVSLVD